MTLRREVAVEDNYGIVIWHAAERVLTLTLCPPMRGGSGKPYAAFAINRCATGLDGDGIEDARDYLAACMEDAAALAEAIPIAEAWVAHGTMPEEG